MTVTCEGPGQGNECPPWTGSWPGTEPRTTPWSHMRLLSSGLRPSSLLYVGTLWVGVEGSPIIKANRRRIAAAAGTAQHS